MTIESAAEAILTLINSKPRSPTKEELSEMLRQVLPQRAKPVAEGAWYRVPCDTCGGCHFVRDGGNTQDVCVAAVKARLDARKRRLLSWNPPSGPVDASQLITPWDVAFGTYVAGRIASLPPPPKLEEGDNG